MEINNVPAKRYDICTEQSDGTLKGLILTRTVLWSPVEG